MTEMESVSLHYLYSIQVSSLIWEAKMQPEIHNESVKHKKIIVGIYLLECATHLTTFRVAEG